MAFVDWELPVIIERLNQLAPNKKALWGNFTAQGMIEHLSNGIKMSMGRLSFPMEVNEERAEKLKNFLFTAEPFARNINVKFVDPSAPLLHEELDLAVDEFVILLIEFEAYSRENPSQLHPHPHFGLLTAEEWKLLHIKHIDHHFNQFGI